MDGYDVLVKTDMWRALEKAKDAAFELQHVMERNGFHSNNVFQARCGLTDTENQLRHHFKHAPEDGPRSTDSETMDAYWMTVAPPQEPPRLFFPLMEMAGEVDSNGQCPNCANPPHVGPCQRKQEPPRSDEGAKEQG